MGLFSHKKKDSIVGPSGYAYTDESGEEPLTDRHRRHSSNSSSTHSPRRSVDQPTRTSQDVSTRKSVDHGDRNLAGVGAAAATAPVVGSAMAGRKSLDNENDVNKSRRDEQFTSGVLPQTQAQATPVVPAQVQPNVGSSGGRLSEGQRLKVVETAKAPHAHPGREKDSVLSEEDAKNAEHDHKYLEPVVRESFQNLEFSQRGIQKLTFKVKLVRRANSPSPCRGDRDAQVGPATRPPHPTPQ